LRDTVQLPHPIKVIVPMGPCPTMIVISLVILSLSRPDDNEDVALPKEIHEWFFSYLIHLSLNPIHTLLREQTPNQNNNNDNQALFH